MLIVFKVCLCLLLVELGILLVNRLSGIIVIRERALPDPGEHLRLSGIAVGARPDDPPAPPEPRGPPAPISRVSPPLGAPVSRVPPSGSPLARKPAAVTEPGVQIDAMAVRPLGSQCRVCANSNQTGLVLCSLCEAPHHEDCWHYNQGCSTYGCRSGVARPVS